MYRISYEKCVCFIFLVILAVLSCSGFRIDNLVMTDISKRNSHTSNSLLNSDEFFDRLFSVNATAPTFRHRIRHHRQLRAQAHTSRVLSPTPQPNEHFAQIPSTDLHQNPLLPTRSIVRSQRSNDQRRNKKQNFCPEHDVSWKAYKANAIVIAKVESKSSKCKENCTVFFKVTETLKRSSFSVDKRFSIKFSSDKGSTNCEYDDLTNRSQFLVRTKIDQSKEYILFLNKYGAHNFSAVFVPEIRKKKTLNVIHRVINPNFTKNCIHRSQRLNRQSDVRCKAVGNSPEERHYPAVAECSRVGLHSSETHHVHVKKMNSSISVEPKPVKMENPQKGEEKLQRGGSRSKRLKLVCKVRGFPIPIIYWKRNNTLLHPNSRQRITQKKRKSTLVIRNLSEADLGSYECVARGVDGKETSHAFQSMSRPTEKPGPGISIDKSGGPCTEPMKTDYCHNGGSCFYIESMREYGCICGDDYTGLKCEQKVSDQSSEHDESKS